MHLTLPNRLLMIDIDGLRQDVFHRALGDGRIPHLARLLQGGVDLDPCSTAPSITFCAQSTIFTGCTPAQHGMVGNQFFDRFGDTHHGGEPRFYAFDIGDTLAVQDAVATFSGEMGLVGEVMLSGAPTLYEQLPEKSAVVAYQMIARGAADWIRPNLLDIARFTKGGNLFGISAQQYDAEMVQKLIEKLRTGTRAEVVTAYFMGLDHESHHNGPQAQLDYLSSVVDGQVGQLVEAFERMGWLENLLVGVVSDHGQIGVIADDRHSLRLSFPFDREMGYLFDALGLDVHDKPGEGPNCDAVVASNGGLAQVYLQNRMGSWRDRPRLESDVLPVARAFWEASETGRYAPDLYGALAGVLVRDVEHGGWDAPFAALTPAGEQLPVEEYFALHPEIETVDAGPRLRALVGSHSGDILLLANYAGGFYFGGPTVGVHGGLHPHDSLAVASFAWVRARADQQRHLREVAEGIAADQRRAAGRHVTGLEVVTPVVKAMLG